MRSDSRWNEAVSAVLVVAAAVDVRDVVARRWTVTARRRLPMRQILEELILPLL